MPNGKAQNNMTKEGGLYSSQGNTKAHCHRQCHLYESFTKIKEHYYFYKQRIVMSSERTLIHKQNSLQKRKMQKTKSAAEQSRSIMHTRCPSHN